MEVTKALWVVTFHVIIDNAWFVSQPGGLGSYDAPGVWHVSDWCVYGPATEDRILVPFSDEYTPSNHGPRSDTVS